MARPCLALLRNISGCFKVADKSVRNSSINAALEAAKKEYERLGIPYVEEER
ncbi:MAG: hypothetical protein IIU78_04340 [Alistipes sp.]|nr:hypothetical protein [Alistipes sp.]